MRVQFAGVVSFLAALAVVPAEAADWTQDLSGLGQARLSGDAKTLLGGNGFVLAPSDYADIADIYEATATDNQPIFVTTDAVLHAGHIFFDYLLRIVEIDRLYGAAERLTDTMMALSAAQSGEARDADLKEAARLNIGFFAVAKAQFSPGHKAGQELDGIIGKELLNIAAHEGMEFRALLPYVDNPSLDETPYAYEDYSQYVPRGHYTRNDLFARYFKAMIWYGRIDFKLLAKETGAASEHGRKMTLQALLIADALARNREALRLWRQLYEATAYFVGKSDDLTVDDYAALTTEIFPGSGVERFSDKARQAEFRKRAARLRPPKILGGAGGSAAQNLGFRFMGQRFIPDSYIFQEHVYGAAGLNGAPAEFNFTGSGKPFTMEVLPGVGPVRAFPTGLDVMAVLGSRRARDILQQAGDTSYRDYERQVTALAAEFAAKTPAQWRQNLYWRWLHALRPLLEAPRANPPQAFLASPMWVDKNLQTALGSWAELRHDTILYAKQSYTGLAKSMVLSEPQKPYGYVEPAPEVYGRLAEMFGALRANLNDLGIAVPGMTEKLSEFESVLVRLKAISEHELAARPLGDFDYAFINGFDAILRSLTRFPPELMKRITSDTDSRMDIIADVHTEPNTRQVLEVAVGSPANIYVLVRDERGYRLCRGGVFTYYEFKQPMAARLTDEAWQKMGREGKRPPRADWIRTLGD